MRRGQAATSARTRAGVLAALAVVGVGMLIASRRAPPAAPAQTEPRLIGLVELSGLFGARDPDGPPGAVAPDSLTPVPLLERPVRGAREVARIWSPDAVEWRELDYEAPAAVAYGVENGWVRLALIEPAGGRAHGWAPPEHAGTLHRLEALLADGLAYLTPAWDGGLTPGPAAGSSEPVVHARPPDENVDVNVLSTVEVNGGLWVQVEVLEAGRCTTPTDPAALATGWLPALADDGRPNLWFYARGC